MKNIFYAIAFLLIITWLIAFISYGVGGMIHLLLVIAFIAIILSFFQKTKTAQS